MICQETTNYKKRENCDEKIHLYYFHHFVHDLVTRIYYLVMCLILISSILILLISIIYIVFVYTFLLFTCLSYLLFTCLLSCNCFVQNHIHCLHSVCIHCSVIYLSMQLLFIFDIVFIVHYITFNILYLITIFDICHCYSWDFSLYLYNVYYLIFSIIFTLIYTQHFLYIDIWLSFSWSAYFDRAYIAKFSTLMFMFRTWTDCKRDFQILISKFVYEFLWFFLIICVQFCHFQKVNNQFDSESCQALSCWNF